MRRMLLTRSALADIDGHVRYLESANQKAAERLLRQIEQALAALSIFPFAGRNLGKRRKFPIPGTTLVLVYRLQNDAIEITRCFDGRTNWTRQVHRSSNT